MSTLAPARNSQGLGLAIGLGVVLLIFALLARGGDPASTHADARGGSIGAVVAPGAPAPRDPRKEDPCSIAPIGRMTYKAIRGGREVTEQTSMWTHVLHRHAKDSYKIWGEKVSRFTEKLSDEKALRALFKEVQDVIGDPRTLQQAVKDGKLKITTRYGKDSKVIHEILYWSKDKVGKTLDAFGHMQWTQWTQLVVYTVKDNCHGEAVTMHPSPGPSGAPGGM